MSTFSFPSFSSGIIVIDPVDVSGLSGFCTPSVWLLLSGLDVSGLFVVPPSSLGGCGSGVGAGVTGSVGSDGFGSGVTSVSLPSVVGGVSTCILHTWLASTIVPSSLYSTLPM